MAALLLDTDVVSATAHADRNPAVAKWIIGQAPNELYLSAVTFGELSRGIEMLPVGRNRARLAAWLAEDVIRRFERKILAFDQAAGAIWGRLMADGTTAGRPRSALDMQIAATAIRHHLGLATRNTRDFAGTGVALVNPWTD